MTNAAQKTNDQEQKTNNNKKVITDPKDVAALALSHLNQVNAKKDELTIAIKGLSDLTTQLVNVYASNMNTIQQMQVKYSELES